MSFPVTTTSNISGGNSALTISLSGITGKRWLICGYSISTRGAAVSGDLSILLKDGTTVIWRDTIGDNAVRGTRISQNFVPPIMGSLDNGMSLEVPAGGSGVFIAASLWGYQEV